jgi:exodeoxyribonuclease V alpha subunit
MIFVIPVLMNHFIMLQRNLIYAGITHAKKVCVLIDSMKAWAYAIHHVVVTERNSKLKYMLNLKFGSYYS